MTETTEQINIPLSDEEIQQAANILRRLSPAFLPFDIFRETTRLTATPTVELVPLRRQGGHTEVLLFKRPDDDPNWPGQLHTPGTVVRATDAAQGLQAPLDRLYKDELQVVPALDPRYVTSILNKVARGSELATILYLHMSRTEAPTGAWYPASELPDTIVETQRNFIADAVTTYERGAHV